MAAGASEAGGGGRLPSAVGGDVVGFLAKGIQDHIPRADFVPAYGKKTVAPAKIAKLQGLWRFCASREDGGVSFKLTDWRAACDKAIDGREAEMGLTPRMISPEDGNGWAAITALRLKAMQTHIGKARHAQPHPPRWYQLLMTSASTAATLMSEPEHADAQHAEELEQHAKLDDAGDVGGKDDEDDDGEEFSGSEEGSEEEIPVARSPLREAPPAAANPERRAAHPVGGSGLPARVGSSSPIPVPARGEPRTRITDKGQAVPAPNAGADYYCDLAKGPGPLRAWRRTAAEPRKEFTENFEVDQGNAEIVWATWPDGFQAQIEALTGAELAAIRGRARNHKGVLHETTTPANTPVKVSRKNSAADGVVFLVHEHDPEVPKPKQLFQVVVGKDVSEEDELLALTRVKNLLQGWKAGEFTDVKAQKNKVFPNPKAKAKPLGEAKPKAKGDAKPKAKGEAQPRRRSAADAASGPERQAQAPRVSRPRTQCPESDRPVQFSEDEMSFEAPSADYDAMPMG